MNSISTIEEVRQLLAKGDLSSEEVRELFLYFMHREEEEKRASNTVAVTLLSVLQTLSFVMTQMSHIIPGGEAETIQEMQNLVMRLKALLEFLQPKAPLQ